MASGTITVPKGFCPTSVYQTIYPSNQNVSTSISVDRDTFVSASLHVVANTDGIAVMAVNGVNVMNCVATNGACNYWAVANFFVRKGGSFTYRLSSNAGDSVIYKCEM